MFYTNTCSLSSGVRVPLPLSREPSAAAPVDRTQAHPRSERSTVKRLAASALAVTILLAGASAASARDPRDEKERLRPADMRLAARATLTRADLAGGWKRQPDTPDDNESR